MANNRKLFKEHILELLDLRTTPENALQLLSSPCLLPNTYSSKDFEPIVIYTVCLSYVAAKTVCIEGIWEDFIKKIGRFNPYYSSYASQVFCQFNEGGRFTKPATKLCRKFIPIKEGPRVSSWLDEVLSTTDNCLNPYVRLKLFFMKKIFDDERDTICLKKLRTTFIHTITEIIPLHLFPSDDENDMIFTSSNLYFIVNQLNYNGEIGMHNGGLQKDISKLIEQFNEKNEVTHISPAAKFLCSFMQIIGALAVIAGSNSNYREQIQQTKYCFMLLKELVNCDNHQPGMSPWKQFLNMINLPPFRSYTIGLVLNLTDAIIKNRGDLVELMMSFRDIIMRELDISSRTSELPKLLLSRQINGPAHVRRHSLLLKKLCTVQDNLEDFNNIDKIICNIREIEDMWDDEEYQKTSKWLF